MKQLLLLLLTAVLVAQVHAREKPYDPENEGYVVIGSTPADFAAQIRTGEADGPLWKPDHGRAEFFGPPKDGYIVLRVPADVDLAITRIRPLGRKHRSWTWCRTAFTPSFRVKPGQVAYFGDINYKWPDDLEPYFTTTQDFERARAHVDANFPELRGKLEPGTAKGVRSLTSCSQNGSVS